MAIWTLTLGSRNTKNWLTETKPIKIRKREREKKTLSKLYRLRSYTRICPSLFISDSLTSVWILWEHFSLKRTAPFFFLLTPTNTVSCTAHQTLDKKKRIIVQKKKETTILRFFNYFFSLFFGCHNKNKLSPTIICLTFSISWDYYPKSYPVKFWGSIKKKLESSETGGKR